MLGSEPIIRYEGVGASAQGDVADEVSERPGGSSKLIFHGRGKGSLRGHQNRIQPGEFR